MQFCDYNPSTSICCSTPQSRALHALYVLWQIRPSVCLSVCPSHTGIVSKRVLYLVGHPNHEDDCR